MGEEIEEYLEENFEFINFKVNFIKVRTYEIICELLIQDNNKYKTIRTSFIYIWHTSSTKESNLTSIRLLINKSILKMFIKGDAENE